MIRLLGRRTFVTATAGAVAMIIGGSAIAQPSHLQPASVLIYPLFDSQPQSATVINVTNTNEDRTDSANGFVDGDVLLHYIYTGQEPSGRRT